MAYKIVNMYVSPSKYNIKAPYPMNPNTITIHETDNNASPENEAAYMRSNNLFTSWHAAFGEDKIVQTLPFNRNAWAAGDGVNGPGNRRSIHFEICYNKDNGYNGDMSARMIKAIDNCALYTAHVLIQLGWGVDRLRQHYDWTGKHCPRKIRQENKWNGFKRQVQGYIDEIKGVKKKPAAPSTPKASGSSYKVKPGDSLWAIAKANKTTVAKLKELNGLKSNVIKVGQTLKISGTPAKKFDKYKNRGRSTKAHFSGTIDSLGAEVRKRRGSRSSGFNWNEKAGYSLKPGSKVYIFEVHDGWGRIYTGKRTGKGSNEWVYLDRVKV